MAYKKVIKVLRDKGVKNLYHANTVLTATQFLRHKSLLSRGTIERRHLLQTSQSSDDIDKTMSLWFDVFTDSVDIHKRVSNVNVYGPVLFVLDLEQIRTLSPGRIWITKLNPTKWSGTSDEQRWFTSLADLETNFTVGTFDQMIVFRHLGGELPLKNSLTRIVLDDPQLVYRADGNEKLDFYSIAFGALRLAMTEGKLDVPIIKRECAKHCKCRKRYSDMNYTKPMFFPGLEE